MQLKLHKPTMAIGYSLRMCAQHVDSTNPGRSNLLFRSKPIPEAKMSNRFITFLAISSEYSFMTDQQKAKVVLKDL